MVLAVVATLVLVMAVVVTLALAALVEDLVASLALAVLLEDLVALHSYLLPHHFSVASLPFITIMTGGLVAQVTDQDMDQDMDQVTARATAAVLVIAPIQTLAAQILAAQILAAQILVTQILAVQTLVDTAELAIPLPTTKINSNSYFSYCKLFKNI
jgi:hypothetical protein